MANEVTVSMSLSFSKSTVSDALSWSDLQFDVSGSKIAHLVQNVAITEEVLELGDIGTIGWMIVRNLDDSNFMEIRPATGAADCIKLKAGECALFRHAGTAPFVIADTATVNIEYLLIED